MVGIDLVSEKLIQANGIVDVIQVSISHGLCETCSCSNMRTKLWKVDAHGSNVRWIGGLVLAFQRCLESL